LLPNLVVYDSHRGDETIFSVVNFRKNQRKNKTPLMPVEAKIDLWLD
jgi:hypothetical protein